jgi:hypothetical protein
VASRLDPEGGGGLQVLQPVGVLVGAAFERDEHEVVICRAVDEVRASRLHSDSSVVATTNVHKDAKEKDMAVAADLDRATDSQWDWVAEQTRTNRPSGGTEGHEADGVPRLVGFRRGEVGGPPFPGRARSARRSAR